MEAIVKRRARLAKLRAKVRRQRASRNGHIHVVSPATASEIRSSLRIGGSQIRNVQRAFEAAGIKV